MPTLPPEITLPTLTQEEYRLLCECVRVANVGMEHVELAVALKQKLLACSLRQGSGQAFDRAQESLEPSRKAPLPAPVAAVEPDV